MRNTGLDRPFNKMLQNGHLRASKYLYKTMLKRCIMKLIVQHVLICFTSICAKISQQNLGCSFSGIVYQLMYLAHSGQDYVFNIKKFIIKLFIKIWSNCCLKLGLHTRFQRAFIACVCVFKVITLV